MRRSRSLAAWVVAVLVFQGVAMTASAYYTEAQIYGMRPNPNAEMALGDIGVTGIEARIYKGVKVKVESTRPNTPASGKFKRGEIILGVNGVTLMGKNPLVVLGKALTKAEATDGKLTFLVKPVDKTSTREVIIKIPVLGAYSETFPLNCEKSKIVISQAADFYAGEDRLKAYDMWNALACLFLLSTGDDQYVARVKEYFAQFLTSDGKVKGIGGNSWHNGYNGIACAEYYLRTGDKSVLPILQYLCDDAKLRQKYGVGWGHWGYDAFPSYEAGGGMQHAAGTQILTTLVMGKACGVNVDEKTLQGALKHWFRFIGHGAIPIADQRYWHIMRSAGRDGSTAAAMQIASGAQGDVTIYKQAKEYLAMSALTSWPARVYDWEVYWHSLSGAMARDLRPDLYNRIMQRFTWRYDLGRQASGGFSWPHNSGTADDDKAGICLALAYTAPLKNLQINGAQRSKYAKDFRLPEKLWGNKADRAFLMPGHHKDFNKYGEEDEMHVLQRSLPMELGYNPGMASKLDDTFLLKNVRHARCNIRMAAAKFLTMNKRYDEIEKLLQDPDPRLRRAALDGINDCRPWFTNPVVGEFALKPEQFTPAMLQAITSMMHDPEEAWFVIDGALQALNHAPVEVIEKNLPQILRWSRIDDWWLRESAFMALMGFEPDEELFVKHLPTIIDIMTKEYNYNPRHKMVKRLQEVLAACAPGSPVRKLLVDGFSSAAINSTVLPDVGNYKRSGEGAANIIEVARAAMEHAPETTAVMADALSKDGRLKLLDTESLMQIVKAHDGHLHDRHVGLYPSLDKLPAADQKRVTDSLYNTFRPELIQRFHKENGAKNATLINMLVELTKLKESVEGWQPIGTPEPAKRMWRYRSFDPLTDTEKLHPRIGAPKRLRMTTLPEGMDGWFLPGFDDSAWAQGLLPVGKGRFIARGHGRGATTRPDFAFKNNSDWGDGEFIAMRNTFDLSDADLNKDFYRIRILADQGYHIYLNGQKIHTYIWFMGFPTYREIMLTENETKYLKKGVNTLAVHSVVRFEKGKTTDDYHAIGQVDIIIDALKKSDLGL